MKVRRRFTPRSLATYLILSFAVLVSLTVVAAGLLAFRLLEDELERQSLMQLEQGRRATQALFAARWSELSGLAQIVAARPTLRSLLSASDEAALVAYLEALPVDASLDLVVVCREQEIFCGGACVPPLPTICQEGLANRVVAQPGGELLLLSAAPLMIEGHSYPIIVGLSLNQPFVDALREQTGLEHALSWQGAPVVFTYPLTPPEIPVPDRRQMVGDGVYLIDEVSLDSKGLTDFVGLEVSAAVRAAQRWRRSLLVGGTGIALLGTLLGAYLAAHVGRPLQRLAETAAGGVVQLTPGDLPVREVATVARVLEETRDDLARTLASLQEEKRWLEQLLEAIGEGIVTLDEVGRVTFFSRGAERITGYVRERVLGEPISALLVPLEEGHSFWELLPPPGGRRLISVSLAGERPAMLSMTGARMIPPGDDRTRMALVFRDVSEEEAMHRLMGHFMANVAHEFRTPLAALAASVELLVDQTLYLSRPELMELLGNVHLSVLNLQAFIDNLLEAASIEAGHFRVHMHPVSVSEILTACLPLVEPLLEKRQQHLKLEIPSVLPLVRADLRRTVQVLVNLLDNASKYGPDGSPIRVQVSTAVAGVRVAVLDQGPGIPPESRAQLFRQFSRVGAAPSGMQHGAGLGLLVVKRIVEAQGGEVGIETVDQGGACFWFTLRSAERGEGHESFDH